MVFSLLMKEENRDVGRKLGIATLLMFTVPILVFFVGLYVFEEKEHPDNWAAAMAITVVNMIVFGYVYSAFMEDDSDLDDNDVNAPRVGIFKQRTD